MTLKLTSGTSLNPEEILVSRSRIKILRALAMKGPLNISGIKKYTGLNHKSITKALQVLKYAKVVGEVDLDRTRSFRIRVENEKASAVDRLIKSFGKQKGITKESEGEKATTTSRPTRARTQFITKYKEPHAPASIIG